MKKFLSAILTIVLLLNIPVTVSANDSLIESITLQGIEMPVEDFVEEYISTEVTSINLNEYARCDLELSNIIIDDDEIEMDANLYVNDELIKTFGINGNLYNSFKSQLYDVNDVIIDATTDSNEITVMLFNMIFSDGFETNINTVLHGTSNMNKFFLINNYLSDTDAVRIYIKVGEKIYLFEDVMPNVFEECNNEYLFMSDPLKDMIWYSSLTTPTVSVIDTSTARGTVMLTEMLKENSTYNTLATKSQGTHWAGDDIYITNFVLNGVSVQQRSVPFGVYEIYDVDHSGEWWRGSFYVCESTTYGGENVDYIENSIYYDDVSINIICGTNSKISMVSSGGVVRQISSLQETSSVVLDVFRSNIDWWSTAHDINTIIASLFDSGKDVNLSGGSIGSLPDDTTVASITLPEGNYKLINNSYSDTNYIDTETNSHYLLLDGYVKSTLSESSNATTDIQGQISFSWNACQGAQYLSQNARKTISKSYTSSY